jgi:hypothetical protein
MIALVSKMATIDEFALKNIGLWWRYGISRHCDEWKYFIIGRIFESEIILIPPSLQISESSHVDAYQIPYYSRGIEEAKRTHPRFADCYKGVSKVRGVGYAPTF